MGNSNSHHKISAQDKAILDLKNQRDALHRHQKKLTHLSTTYTLSALTALQNQNRPLALLLLRKKKYQESLISQTDKQLEQLEILTNSVEFALIQKDVVFGLKRGNEVLGQIQREMGGKEEVERVVERVVELREWVGGVEELLGGEGGLNRGDEEEVEGELEELEREVVGLKVDGKVEQKKEDGLAAKLPDVPKKDLPKTKQQEEEIEEEEAQQEGRQAILA